MLLCAAPLPIPFSAEAGKGCRQRNREDLHAHYSTHSCNGPLHPPSFTAVAPLRARRFSAVIHFAGRKYVNESVADPLIYYQHNVLGTINLAACMAQHGCKNVSWDQQEGGVGQVHEVHGSGT